MNQEVIIDDEISVRSRFESDAKYSASSHELRKTYVTQLQVAKYSVANQTYPNQIINAGTLHFYIIFTGKSSNGVSLFYICGY